MIITSNQARWLILLLEEPDYNTMTRTQDINELETLGFITVSPGPIAWGQVYELRFNITEEGKAAFRGYLKKELEDLNWEKKAAVACMKANLNGPWSEAAVLRIAEKISRELRAYQIAIATKPEIFEQYKLAGGDPRELE